MLWYRSAARRAAGADGGAHSASGRPARGAAGRTAHAARRGERSAAARSGHTRGHHSARHLHTAGHSGKFEIKIKNICIHLVMICYD